MSQNQKSNSEGRLFAVLAYVLPVIGGMIGLALNGENSLTRKHAHQTIGAVLTMVVALLIWAVAGYFIALIPYVGPVTSVCLFTLVVAVYIIIVINWIVGFIHAIQGRDMDFLIASRLTKRLFGNDAKLRLQTAEGSTA